MVKRGSEEAGRCCRGVPGPGSNVGEAGERRRGVRVCHQVVMKQVGLMEELVDAGGRWSCGRICDDLGPESGVGENLLRCSCVYKLW
ncbi:uncharacterized protein PHALS_04730 [Plasmopara halstedii]|uniref:Uncharacterized protein n=1 Tax=Plasmopara halstedii TaxID=4781 RepID=A0A0N7L7N6_PLAHL|nr:uncharacterized protein PHALS_04730 [Plasmopara halstedii]CEG47579.1 hypothetical protein PHALS_04730 [Plasmopara halstedii]|eukprot:XP_024583948.1 hypothetical protein PHALS_04730 [Plasmopara halstedii]